MVDFSEPVNEHGSEVERFGKDLRRCRCSPEGTREQAVGWQIGDSDRNSASVRKTFGGQWRVQLALATTFAIPNRFTVSSQEHLIHG
jgi:hypothetical protein